MVPLDPMPYPIDTLPGRGDRSAVALEDRTGALTYAELEAGVGRLAHWLAAQGLAPGDRVASWLPKTRTSCLMPLAAPDAEDIGVTPDDLEEILLLILRQFDAFRRDDEHSAFGIVSPGVEEAFGTAERFLESMRLA